MSGYDDHTSGWIAHSLCLVDLSLLSYRLIRYTEGEEERASGQAVKISHIDAFIKFCGAPERHTELDNAWQTLRLTSFPNKYLFDAKHGTWRRRSANSPIGLGRMYPVHPNKGDLFYLRLLLCSLTGADVQEIVEGATSNQDICCVCHTRHSSVALQPCNMIIVCRTCADELQSRARAEGNQTFRCPFCRADVESYVQVQDTYDARPLDAYILKRPEQSFEDVCLERGLKANDGEWQAAMEEANHTATSQQLRNLFVHILMNCMPQNPRELFERFCQQMGDEYRTYLDSLGLATDANVRTCVLFDLRNHFDVNTKRDKKILQQLPAVSAAELAFIQQVGYHVSTQLGYAYDYNTEEETDHFESKYELCKKVKSQKILIDGVKAWTEAGEQFLLFVDAPGGCGKTFCFNCLLAYLRSVGKIVIAVATTGIAALQLTGGKTAHTSFRIPLDPTGSRRGKFPLGIDAGSNLGKLLINDVDVIIWDEAPMINRDIFDTIDDWMRRERNDDRPFGGVNVILGGDFRQCLPVVRGGTRSDMTTASIINSETFNQFSVVRLVENIRVENCKRSDPERSAQMSRWADDLVAIGNGVHNAEEEDATFAHECRLPDSVQMKPIQGMNDIDSMIDDVFGDLAVLSRTPLSDLAAHRSLHSAILCPIHTSVDAINARCLQKWEGETFVKYAIDTAEKDYEQSMVTLEHLTIRSPTGSPPARLELKIGMPLVMLRNMSEELMNGTRMLLLDIKTNVLQCLILNGRFPDRIVYIPRFLFKHEGPDQPLTWYRRQYPVKPCWALTINKSQAQTLQRTAVCLVEVTNNGDDSISVEPIDVFSHGQLYVGLSRCGDPDKVCIYTTLENCRCRTLKNVVYNEGSLDNEESR